jgi:hypothetical protein
VLLTAPQRESARGVMRSESFSDIGVLVRPLPILKARVAVFFVIFVFAFGFILYIFLLASCLELGLRSKCFFSKYKIIFFDRLSAQPQLQ